MKTTGRTIADEKADAFAVDRIGALAGQRGEKEVWLGDGRSFTWHEFGVAVEVCRRELLAREIGSGAVVVVPGESKLESLAWFFGCASVGAVAVPLRAARVAESENWKDFFHVDWRIAGGRILRVDQGSNSDLAVNLFATLKQRAHPGLILATGGTTGVPKLVLHDLAVLLSTIPVREGRVWRTMPLMRFDHIGGLDMAWRALAGGQILCEPPDELSPDAVAAAIERHGVEVLPATPSFLNLLLLAGVHKAHDLSSLRIIPYGAEPMSDGLLSRLKTAWPQVEFVQRFGTSETGALPVQEGETGLVLRPEQKDFEWKVLDDELWVKSPTCALGYLSGDNTLFGGDGWFKTGDLVQLADDGALRVLGRRQELINVGGEKVLPAEVEGVLMNHPLVADCRVGAMPNSVIGQVVTADIVWRGLERNPVAVKRLLHEFAVSLLARHKLPVVMRLVDQIESTRNLKKSRAAQP